MDGGGQGVRGDGCRRGGEKRIRETQKSNGATRSGDVTGTDVGGGGEWRLRRRAGERERKRGEELHAALLGAVDEERERRAARGVSGGEHGGGTNT